MKVIASLAQPGSIAVICCDRVVRALEEVGPSKLSPKDEGGAPVERTALRPRREFVESASSLHIHPLTVDYS